MVQLYVQPAQWPPASAPPSIQGDALVMPSQYHRLMLTEALSWLGELRTWSLSLFQLVICEDVRVLPLLDL